MTPSLRIDRVFAGVGRIALASGTRNKATFKRINAMLTGCFALGDLDTLMMVRDGLHAPLVVLHAYERGQLSKLSKEAAKPLVPALWAFHETHEAGKSYRDDLATSIRHVEKVAGKASIPALPQIVRAMKDDFRHRPVAYNRLRTHMLAFATEIHGKHSPLWIELTRLSRFKKAEGKRPRVLKRRPLTVVEFDAVCEAFTDHIVYGGRKGSANKGRKVARRTIYAPDLAAMARALAFTGMRPAEYWRRGGASWDTEAHHVRIDGTKTAAARRVVPLLSTPWDAMCGEQFFRARFAEATTKALREGLDAYSLRRTFASWCESAGIVESRRKAYLGHGPKTVTDIYLQTNVLPFVEEDARILADWITAERSRAAARPSLKLETGS
jgi:integrase